MDLKDRSQPDQDGEITRFSKNFAPFESKLNHCNDLQEYLTHYKGWCWGPLGLYLHIYFIVLSYWDTDERTAAKYVLIGVDSPSGHFQRQEWKPREVKIPTLSTGATSDEKVDIMTTFKFMC